MSGTRGLTTRRPLWILCAIPAAAIFLTGCYYAPRGMSRLEETSLPKRPTAVLPVTAGDVEVTVTALDQEDPYKPSASGVAFSSLEAVANATNKVLNTLSKGRDDRLEGPSELAVDAGVGRSLDRLRVALDDPGPEGEAWKREILAETRRETGYAEVLRVRPKVEVKPDSSYTSGRNAGMNPSWNGTVTVTIETLDLESGKVTGGASGEARFKGCAGVIGIGGGPAPYAVAIPYGWGDTISHAVDEAARKAFANLYGGGPEGGKK